mgnify:CR=1 FL=1
MAILHKNINNEADIHNPKWFQNANNGDIAFKNEKGQLESTDELLLPAALNFVDGSVAPPTTNTGDIYILSSGGSVNAGWGGVSLQDWVRYDGTAWNSITPQKGSMCYDKNADALKVFDGSAWAGLGSSFGKFGIADSSGAYTYYDDFQTALNAASSGDTVEMFTNVTVSSASTVTLIDGVNINMNGYKYENTGSTNVNMVTLPSSATVTIYNGYFKRSGGTNGVTTNLTLDAFPSTSSNLYLKGVTFENTISTCLYIKGALVEGGTFIGNGANYNVLTAGPSTKMIGSTFIGTSSGHVGVNSTTLINCTSYANSGMAFYVGAGILLNCVGESISNIGIRASGGNNTLSNCTGKSESNYGIRVGGDSSTVYTKCKNTTGFSSSNYGFYIDGFAEVRNCDAHSASLAGALITSTVVGATHKKPRIYDCTFISEGANGAFANGSVQMFDSSFISQYDNANGHGLTTGNVTGASDPTILSGCTFQCENASANGFKNTLAGYETKIAACKFHGMTTDINDVNSNQMSNTPDSYNNILI